MHQRERKGEISLIEEIAGHSVREHERGGEREEVRRDTKVWCWWCWCCGGGVYATERNEYVCETENKIAREEMSASPSYTNTFDACSYQFVCVYILTCLLECKTFNEF